MAAPIRLNHAQNQAVTEAGPCLVVALPGSGKTRLLVSKAAHLLAQSPDARIVAVTFTRDSALELKERVVLEVGEEQAKRVVVGTFHSLCLQQLKLAGRPVNLLSPAEQEAFVRRAWEAAGQGIAEDEAMKVIEEGKTSLGGAPAEDAAARLLGAYTELLARNQALDFQDLLIGAVTGMRDQSVPPIPATHMFVDEFQDTDGVQYAWIREHSLRGVIVTAVGDDDQCQPADTQVLTDAGWRAISALDPARDTLMSFDGERLVRAHRFQVARRVHHGVLVTVSAGGRQSRATPDHFWRARWRGGAEDLHAVFLLRRGESWRLCARRLLRDDGSFALDWPGAVDADAAWALAVAPDFHSALARQASLALGWGLPLVELHERYLGGLVQRCLAALGLDAQWPLWRRGEPLSGQFRVRSLNLLPQWMEIPVSADGRLVAWHPVDRQSREAGSQTVFSLNVEPHHTYVADALVTCNCIYSWRHAMGYEGMLRFERDHKAKRVVLDANYRCKQEILESAGRVIAHNTERMDKELIAAKGPGGQVRYARFGTREQEADQVARAAAAAPDRWTVLARTNRQLDVVEAFLSIRHIPYYRTDNESLWDKPCVSFWLALLRDVAAGAQPARLDQFLHWAGVSHDELDELHSQVGADLLRLPRRLPAVLSKPSRDTLRSFAEMHRTWRASSEAGRVDLVIVGTSQWMLSRAADAVDETLLRVAAKAFMKLQGSLAQRINWVLNQSAGGEQKGVALMTLHSSKGLEFDHVWIIGTEETVLPNEKSILEEERRLMYVGMTRARELLVVSGSDERPASRFVAEAALAEQV